MSNWDVVENDRLEAMSRYSQNDVWSLDPDETVCCYYCMRDSGLRDDEVYKKGEAFLCGAGHNPCDGNANYICLDHLDDDAIINEDGRSFTVEEYKAKKGPSQSGEGE